MTDVHDKITRSYNMRQIKGKNTKPELLVRRFLFANGFRYKLHDKNLIGRPDIVLPKHKCLIFVNGCFWHGHNGCQFFKIPATNTVWWENKISKTIENDITHREFLSTLGWQVIIIWECQLKPKRVTETLNQLLYKLNKR